MTEEQIKQELDREFGLAADRVRIPRARRIFVEVPREEFEKVFAFARSELQFNHLISITGTDEGDTLAFLYHLANNGGVVLNIKTCVAKERPVIRSVTKYFPGAEIYERELVDLLGAKVEGLAGGHRYPLTDDWPKDQHPLRKDWKHPEPEARAG